MQSKRSKSSNSVKSLVTTARFFFTGCSGSDSFSSDPSSFGAPTCCLSCTLYRRVRVLQSVSQCFTLQIVHCASHRNFRLVFLISAWNRSVTGIRTSGLRAARPCSRCSSACHQIEKALVRIMFIRCTLLYVSAIGCVPAAQRVTAKKKIKFGWRKRQCRGAI